MHRLPLIRFFLISISSCFLFVASAQERVLDEENTLRLRQLIDSPNRSQKLRDRNQYRHPSQTLDFFDLRPELTVVEVWPGGQSGWYRSILQPYIEEGTGTYIGLQEDSDFPDPVAQVADESADRVLVFRAHGFMIYDRPAQEYYDAIFAMLKLGGIFAIVDHRGDEAIPQDPKGENGYVNQSHVEKLAANAGFVLLEQSEINANTADSKDYPNGVYSLPPTLRGSLFNRSFRARMQETGESDRMTLKFIKPK